MEETGGVLAGRVSKHFEAEDKVRFAKAFARQRGIALSDCAAGHWWVCVEDGDGTRVNIVQERYDLRGLSPPFHELPLETAAQEKKRTDEGL